MAQKQGNLVNHTIPALTAGVSQQFSEARFETQVSEMINCIPSVSRGLLRRNPLSSVASLGVTFTSDDFTYTYDRGTGTEQYLIVIPGNGTWRVYNLNTGVLKGSGTDSYLNNTSSLKAKDVFKCVTIGDYTFTVNTQTTVRMNSVPTVQTTTNNQLLNWYLAYWIKKTSAVVVKSGSVNNTTTVGDNTTGSDASGSLIEGYRYTLRNTASNKVATVLGNKETRPGYTNYSIISATEIASKMSEYCNSNNLGGVFLQKDSFVYSTNTDNPITYDDTFGGEASLLIHKEVKSASELPTKLPFDKIIKISGAFSNEIDDYYMRYTYSTGSWEETVAPNIAVSLNTATMPHCFIRLANDTFTFSTYKEVNSDGVTLGDTAWRDRLVGDETSIPDPSFVDKTITNIIFHKNRLGFITKDSITLSETGEYGNFFGTTVQSLPDDDPIDLLVATTDVTILRHAVSTSSALILFSDDAQFTLTSTGGALTPKSATIDTVSNYTYSKSADARAIGNKVFFLSESGGYSQLFAYKLSEGFQETGADMLTTHIPSYLPPSIKQIAGHSVLGYTFYFAPDTDKTKVYILTNTTKSLQDVQNAFHTWKFTKNIVSIHIINNLLYVLFEDGVLANMTLEVPGDITAVSYLDFGTDSYTSQIDLSEFLLKDASGIGTTRGRTQLRSMKYTLNDNSYYKTSIHNNKQTAIVEDTTWLLKTAFWNDTGTWVDTSIWRDSLPLYTREYYNDDKVTLLCNTIDTTISIGNDDLNPDKGFEIATVNIEAYFYQRSSRY